MTLRSLIENYYNTQTEDFEKSFQFQQLESGHLNMAGIDEFIHNLCRSHLKSPQILAFLYAIAPPAAADATQHNLLEEMGLDDAGIRHPDLLYQLMQAAGFSPQQQDAVTAAAQAQVRSLCTDPLMFGTIKELGLSVLLEVTCFEWMLARLSRRLGQALQTHRGLPTEGLAWFYHHSEVDIRHAAEGVEAVVHYVSDYDIEADELATILDITFRENVFIRRYFGGPTLALATPARRAAS